MQGLRLQLTYYRPTWHLSPIPARFSANYVPGPRPLECQAGARLIDLAYRARYSLNTPLGCLSYTAVLHGRLEIGMHFIDYANHVFHCVMFLGLC